MSSRVSPDGMYYWDGQSWISTLSADARHRWDGAAWVPISGQPYITASAQSTGSSRQPTSWTRPLQYAVAGWYVWSAIYYLITPFWMSGIVNQLVNQSIANQERLNPGTSLPPGFADTMTNIMNVGVWVGVAILITIDAVAFIGSLRRWTWIFYTVLVLLGLSALGLPFAIYDAAVGPVFASSSSFTMPTWFYIVGFVTGLPGAALFVWMLIALVTRGPWAMKRVS